MDLVPLSAVPDSPRSPHGPACLHLQAGAAGPAARLQAGGGHGVGVEGWAGWGLTGRRGHIPEGAMDGAGPARLSNPDPAHTHEEGSRALAHLGAHLCRGGAGWPRDGTHAAIAPITRQPGPPQ